MKLRLLALILMICVVFSGCTFFPFRDRDVEYLYSIDTDTYIFCGDVNISIFTLNDTLEIDVDPDDEKQDWRWLLQGFIKRFTYVDGMLIIEYYDKWYTFDVENYEPENKCFDLKEYETVDQLKEIYPDLESYEWMNGRYERNDESIKINGWYEGFKETIPYYNDTIPEYENISECADN